MDLDFTDRLVDVIDEGFDAVVRTGEISDSRLMTRTLGTFHYRLVGSPSYLAEHGTPRTLADLSEHRGLRHLFPSTGKVEEWPLHFNGKPNSPAIKTAAVASAIEPLIHLAEEGIGLACLPDFAIRDQLADRRLIPVLDGAVQHSGSFRILWPSSRYLSPKLRVFVDFMGDNLFPR